jgi:hypothetical protein
MIKQPGSGQKFMSWKKDSGQLLTIKSSRIIKYQTLETFMSGKIPAGKFRLALFDINYDCQGLCRSQSQPSF